ncbi:inositol 1,4,5-trisphosphate receptor-interacting protein [Electrophorus electricus]|uniref:Inositol 1,4,5-trisphosphate receptor-interacting protein n=1 Tax=Electrophorus electricus TaxID=8005 RepID=A0A4W4HGG1_ELEEL|nr:inositol 1,4,5-trisphosphate receptor-interacting protein [Electrophorus electricus]XP_026873428.2 inositol 1,4,5-trisphosphate receptor-interacting protein [Electrophorus electricus]
MQGAISRVCMVVVAAILNHPLLFPKENTTITGQENDILARMKEHEERIRTEQTRLELEISKTDQEVLNSSFDCYGWYFWSALSLVIFFTIEVCRQDLIPGEAPDSAEDEGGYTNGGTVNAKVLDFDKGVLNKFCETSFHPFIHECGRVQEFVEGFADDLLESLRSICDRDVDMELEDFVGVGSMFESWRVCKPPMCDLIVPFVTPEPYHFQFQLWCGASSDIPIGLQGCGRIKLTNTSENYLDCLCGTTNLGEDMLCLLHNRNDSAKTNDHALEKLLCSRNTTFLSKDQVMKWFQISVTRAWGQISHKYEFELTFRNLDSPGALKIRFSSGKVIVLNITPAIQLEDSDAYFISHFPCDTGNASDIYWHLSFTVYERNLLKHMAKSLPENSCHLWCLQLVSFLHRKQAGLTGMSALTNYHFKTALLHLLLNKSPSAWQPQNLNQRLQDLLGFLQKSLQEKRLSHIIIGNPLVPAEIAVPRIFQTAEPINLFRPLVIQRQIYAKMVEHFHEMLKNAAVLIQEYTPHFSNGDGHHGFNHRVVH